LNVASTQGWRPGLPSRRPLRGLYEESLFLNLYSNLLPTWHQ